MGLRWYVGGAAAMAIAACTSFSGNDDGTTGVDGGIEEGGGVDGGIPNDAPSDVSRDVASPKCDDPVQVPQVFAGTAAAPDDVATDGVHVYWSNSSDRTIDRQLITGGPVEHLFTDPLGGGVSHLTLTTLDIVWIVGDRLRFATKTSPDAANQITDQTGEVVALGDDIVYVRGGDGAYRVKPGAGASFLAPLTAHALGASGVRLVYAAPNGDGGAGDAVYTIPDIRSAGAPQYVVGGVSPTRLATDGTDVFVADQPNKKIVRFALNGAGTAFQLAGNVPGIGPIAVDGGNLYVSTLTGIIRVPTKGGCTTQITDKQTSSFAIDGPWVYFTTGKGIARAPK
jgi:hypothetical protein